MPSDQFSRLVNKKGHSERDRDYVLVHDQDCEVPRASDYTGMSTQFAVHSSHCLFFPVQWYAVDRDFVYVYSTPYCDESVDYGAVFVLLSGA